MPTTAAAINFENAVPVEALEDHGPVYAFRFRYSAVCPMLSLLSRCWPPISRPRCLARREPRGAVREVLP
jgi:hypothetical protein